MTHVSVLGLPRGSARTQAYRGCVCVCVCVCVVPLATSQCASKRCILRHIVRRTYTSGSHECGESGRAVGRVQAFSFVAFKVQVYDFLLAGGTVYTPVDLLRTHLLYPRHHQTLALACQYLTQSSVSLHGRFGCASLILMCSCWTFLDTKVGSFTAPTLVGTPTVVQGLFEAAPPSQAP